MGFGLFTFCFFQPFFQHVDVPLVGEEGVTTRADFVWVATELGRDVEYRIVSLYWLDADLKRTMVAGLDDEIIAIRFREITHHVCPEFSATDYNHGVFLSFLLQKYTFFQFATMLVPK